MKIAIVNTQVPFVRGGAEILAEQLRDALRVRDHTAELMRIPFLWFGDGKLADHLLACRLWELNGADRVIALKFPAYCLAHPNKVLWVSHQHRQAYDLLGTTHSDIPDTRDGRALRDLIVRADNQAFATARQVYATSHRVAERLEFHNSVRAPVLLPPLDSPERYRSDAYGDYVYLPGRIADLKRPHLAVSAMRFITSNARLLITGAPENPDAVGSLRRLISRHGLEQRVEIRDGWISEDERLALLAGARAVIFTALDEDLGMVVLEAAGAARAVITCEDAGEPARLITDGQTGRVVAAEPRAIAAAIDALMVDPGLAERLGRQARDHLVVRGPNWDRVVAELTA